MKKLYPKVYSPDAYDFLEQIFNNTYDGIAILTLDGDWIKVNESICKLFGYSRHELFNMNIERIVFREDLGAHQKKYDRLMQGKIEGYRVRQRYFHKDGTIIWVLISVSLIINKVGKPINMIWQFSDITGRKRNQDRLKTMLNVVQEQNERLSSFASIVTHNLRSHSGNLSTIAGFLEEDNTALVDNENFDLLKKAIANLEETVSHLTDVARIKVVEDSQIKVLNLYDYVEKSIYTIKAVAKNANATIINYIDEDLCIKAIPAYLESIILNFLTNAIKYRSEKRLPKIRLTASVQDEYVIFKVGDNGLGIDMEKYGDKLFQMYNTFHSNKDAIGLGLFITRNQIESLGGKVIVTSKVDVGSEFSIYFKSA
jgi:PAS domain S-box-containing protein